MDIKLLKERLAQWDRHNDWVEREDPARLVSPEAALHWADDVREYVVKYCGGFAEKPDKIEGIRIMRERLAFVRLRAGE